ncbi:hypothetical protein OQA88_13325 [Cercophora sp. LCS_1]
MSNDKDAAIFHRFGDVAFLNLLCLQAEIIQLRRDFRRRCMLDDNYGEDDEKSFSSSFKIAREKNSTQYVLLQDMRVKLKEYYDLALQVSQIDALPTPRPSQLKGLRDELNDGANSFLRSAEVDTWNDPDTKDYMALNPELSDSDLFTRSIEDFITGPYHRHIGHRLQTGKLLDEETGTRSYDPKRIGKASAVVATVLSAVLPVLTIFALNSLPTTDQRLGLTVLFTAVFAAMLLTFTSARKVEIFAATATFAAVEVVFIGSALNSGDSECKCPVQGAAQASGI